MWLSKSSWVIYQVARWNMSLSSTSLHHLCHSSQ